MNPDEYPDDILMDEEMTQELINLLIAYRNISSDKDYCEIIDKLILDVESYSGKTVTEVWKEFNASLH